MKLFCQANLPWKTGRNCCRNRKKKKYNRCFFGCWNLTDATPRHLSACVMLQSVDFGQCNKLTDVAAQYLSLCARLLQCSLGGVPFSFSSRLVLLFVPTSFCFVSIPSTPIAISVELLQFLLNFNNFVKNRRFC